MTLEGLITRLEAIRRANVYPANMPVVMNTQSGSGNIDRVVVELDVVENRYEVWLQEKI